MLRNNGMRGTWHSSGTYWLCDCGGNAPLLRIGWGQGGSRGSGKSVNTSRCKRCGIFRPLKRDRPHITTVKGEK